MKLCKGRFLGRGNNMNNGHECIQLFRHEKESEELEWRERMEGRRS